MRKHRFYPTATSRDRPVFEVHCGGTFEKAQQIAAHESPRTTKLYDRTSDEVSLDEIEKILI
jgi:hypothetical protein